MKTTTHAVYVHVGHHMGDLRCPSLWARNLALIIATGVANGNPHYSAYAW